MRGIVVQNFGLWIEFPENAFIIASKIKTINDGKMVRKKTGAKAADKKS